MVDLFESLSDHKEQCDSTRFEIHTPLSESERQERWLRLEHATDKLIQGENVGNLSFEELYRSAYELVTGGQGEYLHSKVGEKIAEVCENLMKHVVFRNLEVEETLISFVEDVMRLQNASRILKDVLLYMERKYCIERHLPTVEEMVWIMFKTAFQPPASEKIMQSFCNLKQEVICNLLNVDLKRRHKAQLKTLKSLVLTLKSFSSPQTAPMPLRPAQSLVSFLRQPLATQYRERLVNICSENQKLGEGVPESVFLELALRELAAEVYVLKALRLDEFVDGFSAIWTEVFVPKYANELLASPHMQIGDLFEKEEITQSRNLFLFLRSEQSSSLAFAQNWEKKVASIIRKTIAKGFSKNKRNALSEVVSLTRRCQSFVHRAFSDDSKMLASVEKGLCAAFNHTAQFRWLLVKAVSEELTLCELFLTSLDPVATGGSSAAVPAVTNVLKTWIAEDFSPVFQRLADKEGFENSYRAQLGQRIVNLIAEKLVKRQSSPTEGSDSSSLLSWWRHVRLVEDVMLDSLSVKCGKAYLHKLKLLLDDAEQACGEPDGLLNVVVFARPRWAHSSLLLTNPSKYPFLDVWVYQYEQRYIAKHQNRKLTWLANQGSAIVRVASADSNLVCTTFQALVLLLFNLNAIWTTETLREASLGQAPTETENLYFDKQLQALCSEVTPVLVAAPDGAVHPNYSFQGKSGGEAMWVSPLEGANLNFQGRVAFESLRNCSEAGEQDEFQMSSVKDLKMNSVKEVLLNSVKELQICSEEEAPMCSEESIQSTSSQHAASPEQSLARNTAIDAALLRLLKHSRTLSHSQLHTKVCQQIEALQPNEVKGRLLQLVERDFVVRSDDDP